MRSTKVNSNTSSSHSTLFRRPLLQGAYIKTIGCSLHKVIPLLEGKQTNRQSDFDRIRQIYLDLGYYIIISLIGTRPICKCVRVKTRASPALRVLGVMLVRRLPICGISRHLYRAIGTIRRPLEYHKSELLAILRRHHNHCYLMPQQRGWPQSFKSITTGRKR
jgi:hypothetical protein